MHKRQIFYYEIRWTQSSPYIANISTLDNHIELQLKDSDMAAAKQVISQIAYRTKKSN